MPELPEVETFKRFIDRYALGQRAQTVTVLHPNILEQVNETAFIETIQGHIFQNTLRRGKHLFIQLKPTDQRAKNNQIPWLYLHFGMTGYLSYTDHGKTIVNAYGDPTRSHAHVRVQFTFEDDSYLDFHEQRLFGKAGLVSNPETYLQAKRLGPDALAVNCQTFLTDLKKRKGQIKPVLLDQSLVAGIGNIYADEILFQGGIHPEKTVNTLSQSQLECIYAQMIAILQNTVDVGADRQQLPQNYLIHVRSKKGHCPQDQSLLSVRTIGGRTTFFCAECQKI